MDDLRSRAITFLGLSEKRAAGRAGKFGFDDLPGRLEYDAGAEPIAAGLEDFVLDVVIRRYLDGGDWQNRDLQNNLVFVIVLLAEEVEKDRFTDPRDTDYFRECLAILMGIN